MSRRYSVSETILRLATRCNRPPAPGLEALLTLAPAPILAQVLPLPLALLLAGGIEEFEEIPGKSI